MQHPAVPIRWTSLGEELTRSHPQSGDIVTDYRPDPLGISIIDRFYAANPAYYMQPFRIL